MTDSLCDMRDYIVKYDIKKVAMPVIGCRLDKLKLGKVKEIIKKVFEDTGIEILVCIK